MSEAPITPEDSAPPRPAPSPKPKLVMGLIGVLLLIAAIWIGFRRLTAGPSITEITASPSEYAGRVVTVRGTVTESVSLPFVGAGYRVMDQDGAKIAVLGGDEPERGERVTVRGTVKAPVDTRVASLVYLQAESD